MHDVYAPRDAVWQAIQAALAATKEETIKHDAQAGLIFTSTNRDSLWSGPRRDFYRVRISDAGAGRTRLSLKYLRFDGGSYVPCTPAVANKAADDFFRRIDAAVGASKVRATALIQTHGSSLR